MYVHVWFMGVMALFITLGILYRVSAAVFFVTFTYMFLLEQARYLNHFYTGRTHLVIDDLRSGAPSLFA